MSKDELFEKLLDTINAAKNTGFCTDTVELDFYLGGDLGIDSVEMLGIWYDLEKALGIKIEDGEKRDLYTLDDVISVLESKMVMAKSA